MPQFQCLSVAVKSNSSKMKETINSSANSLIKIWDKSFTSNHVLRHKAVVQKLVFVLQQGLQCCNRMSSKHESDATHPKSIRSINKQWKETSIEFRINGRKMYFTMIFYNVSYNFTKAYTCLLGKWRNRWGVGGTITGHFGTSITPEHSHQKKKLILQTIQMIFLI